MKFDVNKIVDNKHFFIEGVSYIGKPRSNTAMFVTKKVEHLLAALDKLDECLIFAETGVYVSSDIEKKHAFVFSEYPQLAYARFAQKFVSERFEYEKKLRYTMTSKGYYVCEDTIIPEDAYIEPGCIIGPDVKLGKNCVILANSVIKRSTIGDNFIANEHSVVGANGFTMTNDEEGNKIRIPTLGRVSIGSNVEIGTHNNISCGSGGDTIIEDNVKLDSLIHIGHDVHLHKNVEVTAGVTFSGFVEAGDNSYFGVGCVIRNRIKLGENAFVGMGSNVTKSVDDDMIVAGNPAKPFKKG